jgi:FkbM family methyltransferase
MIWNVLVSPAITDRARGRVGERRRIPVDAPIGFHKPALGGTMVKSLLKALVAVYLWPLKLDERLLYYAKCQGLLTGSEHLYWATRYIRRRSSRGAGTVVIDVGAFDGRTATFLKEHLAAEKVFCVEAHPERATDLARRLAGAGFEVRHFAAAEAGGSGLLHVPSDDRAASLLELDKAAVGHGATLSTESILPVPVMTLDAAFADVGRVLLLKIDTQGTELRVLNGAQTLLKRTRFVLTEMNAHTLYRGTCQYFEVDEFLRRNGFSLVDITVSFRGDDGIQEYDALYERRS